MINLMLSIICFIWQLPQNLIALLILLFSKYKIKTVSGYWISSFMPGYNTNKWTAISLGNYILSSKELSNFDFKHEQGHQIQSKYFGPLYLVIVGIPSFFRILYKNIFKKDAIWYHSGYPENWADTLGRRWYENAKRRFH